MGFNEDLRSDENLAELVSHFIEHLTKTSGETLRFKRTILLTQVVPVLGAVHVRELSLSDIERYKAVKRSDGLAPKTINNHLTVLRALLRFGVALKWMTESPRVTNFRVSSGPLRFLNPEEAERLLTSADVEYRTLILLALRTGLRLGELRALCWADIDFENGLIRVLPRGSGRVGAGNEGARVIPLSPSTVAVLATESRRGPWVFTGKGGQMLTPGACKWPLYRAARRAGLDQLGWQTLRHTFANELVRRGVPVRSIQTLLGYRNAAPVFRYGAVSADDERRAILLLDVKDGVKQERRFRRSSALLVFVPDDRRQRTGLRVPGLGMLKVPMWPRVPTGLPAN